MNKQEQTWTWTNMNKQVNKHFKYLANLLNENIFLSQQEKEHVSLKLKLNEETLYSKSQWGSMI